MACWLFQEERERLLKEKQAKEDALREKKELELRLLQMQEEVRAAQDALVCQYKISTSCVSCQSNGMCSVCLGLLDLYVHCAPPQLI